MDMQPKEHKDLYNKVVQGGLWIVFLRIAVQTLAWGRYVVLARMLGVEDWGLMGIALLMMQTLNTFTSTGFNAALIQKKEDISSYLNTAWTVNIVRAFLLFSIMYVGAPYFAMIKVPQEKIALTIAIIRVMGFSLVLQALSNIGTVFFSKDLKFNKHFFWQISGTVVDASVTIVIACIYKSVWAIVCGRLAGVLCRTVLSYIIHPYRASISFDMSKARGLWGFGKWVFASTILGFLVITGDDYFVWMYIGPMSLGLYQLAHRFALMPATEITNVISSVTFPAYSKVQDDIPRLKAAYLKVLQVTAFASVPMAGLIMVMSPDFVSLFLKDKWIAAVPAMQVLAIRGMSCSLGATRGPVFSGIGKPKLGVFIKSLRLVIIVILIYPLTKRWGIVGAAWTIVLADLLTQPLAFYFTVRILNGGLWEMLLAMLYPIVSTVGMILSIIAVKHYCINQVSYIAFIGYVAVGTVTYLTLIWTMTKVFGYKLIDIIKEQIKMFSK